MLYGQLRKNLGDVFHDLARQKESRIVEGHLQPDHVHMLLSIPPKYSVAQVVGYMKGKSAIYIARNYLGQKKNYNGMHFWARGYFVSTVGADEAMVRAYIRNQEQEDQRVEQLHLFKCLSINKLLAIFPPPANFPFEINQRRYKWHASKPGKFRMLSGRSLNR
jgi:putative transposase